NGRVSPRKGSGQSDKSSTSPQPNGVQQHASNPLSSKEVSADARAISTSQTPQDGESQPRKTLKRESSGDSRGRGSMPPVIEEGQEPPHPSVLPT
ncbi:hypothetical protein H2198_010892, partial [Neophaeococcomyces mojaviensis]